MELFLQILIAMVLMRVWIILNDFKNNKITPLSTTGLISSILIILLKKPDDMINGSSMSLLTTFELILYFILISLLLVHIVLLLKMINCQIKRGDIPNSPLFWLDVLVVIVSIFSWIGLYITPIIYFMYLTFPMFLYSILISLIVKKGN
ncbi:MAG: hypothetical protein ACRC7N_12430 [Clostridium sp.]